MLKLYSHRTKAKSKEIEIKKPVLTWSPSSWTHESRLTMRLLGTLVGVAFSLHSSSYFSSTYSQVSRVYGLDFVSKGLFTRCDLFVCDGDFLKYFLCNLRASVHTVRFCVNAFAKLEIFVLLWIVS